MRNIFTTLGLGFLIWFIPFATGFALLPVVHMHHPLFDTLVVLAMIIGTTLLSLRFLRQTGFHEKGLIVLAGIGMVWVVIAIAMDIPIMVLGPVGMSIHEYMSDIGLMYLGVPVILIGIGHALRSQPV